MRYIPIYRHGRVIAHAKVDNEDYERLSRAKWKLSGYGYAIRKASLVQDGVPACDQPRLLFMHREVLGLQFGDGIHTDHLNHDRLDNRRANLRACTLAENNRNTTARSGSSSPFRGVSRASTKGILWSASVRGEYLGLFADEMEAALVAARRRRELWPDLPEPLLDDHDPLEGGPRGTTTVVETTA